MKTILLIVCCVLGIYCIYYTQARQEQKERADSLYCEVIYMSLDKMTVEPTINRLRLEKTYFENNCQSFNF